MNTDTKIKPLFDEDGFKLPANLSRQFRDVHSGVEYLKHASDEITLDLKVVSKKLSNNTTDLKTIVERLNSIETRQKEHMAVTQKSFEKLNKITSVLTKIVLKHESQLDDSGKGKK